MRFAARLPTCYIKNPRKQSHAVRIYLPHVVHGGRRRVRLEVVANRGMLRRLGVGSITDLLDLDLSRVAGACGVRMMDIDWAGLARSYAHRWSLHGPGFTARHGAVAAAVVQRAAGLQEEMGLQAALLFFSKRGRVHREWRWDVTPEGFWRGHDVLPDLGRYLQVHPFDSVIREAFSGSVRGVCAGAGVEQ